MWRTLGFFLSIAILSTPGALAQTQSHSKSSTFGIEQSRIFIEGKTRQSFWNIQNNSQQNYFYIVEVVGVDQHLNPTKKLDHFLVAPSSGILKPEESKTLRIVRIKDNLSEEHETFSLLRLKLIPSFKASDEKARVQAMMTIVAKLFYRPEKILAPNAIEKAVLTLSYRYGKGKLVISNPSPYWLTFPSIKVNGAALTPKNNKAWMVGPGADLSIPHPDTPRSVTVRAIQENGISTADRAISTGGKM